ncbi:type III secretion system translocon subunit AopB [Aeromonas salmonicida]|uniref:type III secretion system translocon subunit AopB n=1 Tax=Aeromonas salmonicida TaxID=645 RepID=UPI00232D4150|nr:type III secretion system translocon subunit AopB [Aeromonas salmonicida]WCH23619.1 type III secretion system translocon subunit AopB [Aeromonas salmonicida]
MNPISNERSVSPQGNIGNVAGLQPAAEPRSETRLDATVIQEGGVVSSAGVALPPPLAASNDRPGQNVMAEIRGLVSATVENNSKLLPRVGALVTAAFTSPAAFEIELGMLTSKLEQTQTKLKLDDVRRARELNEKKIGENQEKIEEAQQSATEAKKAGIVGKVFGWISAIASVVIGAIMVATGVGAVAGALMIAAGVVGMVSMSVQHAAEAGLISKEVMKHLGPALMGIEIALAAISVAASFGTSIGSIITKVGAKIGGKAAEMSAKLVTKAGELAAKMAANSTVKAMTMTGQGAKVMQLGTQATDVALNVSGGVTKSVQSSKESAALNAQADLQQNKSEMTQLQEVIDKIKDALSQVMEAFQQTMEMIFQMLSARDKMMRDIASRPATT